MTYSKTTREKMEHSFASISSKCRGGRSLDYLRGILEIPNERKGRRLNHPKAYYNQNETKSRKNV